MICALLAAVSSAVSKITPAPTPTAIVTVTPTAIVPTATSIPTPSPTPLPVLVSIVDGPGFWEIAGILSSVILGIVALIISINAYRFAKQQQKREEEMRQREAKITVMDKAFEVYNFFAKEIRDVDFFKLDDAKCISKSVIRVDEISYLSKMIFNDKMYGIITLELFRISTVLNRGIYPTIKNTEKNYCTKEDIIEEFIEYDSFNLNDRIRLRNVMCSMIKRKINTLFEEYRLNL